MEMSPRTLGAKAQDHRSGRAMILPGLDALLAYARRRHACCRSSRSSGALAQRIAGHRHNAQGARNRAAQPGGEDRHHAPGPGADRRRRRRPAGATSNSSPPTSQSGHVPRPSTAKLPLSPASITSPSSAASLRWSGMKTEGMDHTYGHEKDGPAQLR